jgi:hypothetical protein
MGTCELLLLLFDDLLKSMVGNKRITTAARAIPVHIMQMLKVFFNVLLCFPAIILRDDRRFPLSLRRKEKVLANWAKDGDERLLRLLLPLLLSV